jgi:hypothetical protein
VTTLRRLCEERGRDPHELRLAASLNGGHPDDVTALAKLGIDELVIVESPPQDPGAAAQWVAALAKRWSAAISSR